MKCYVGLSYTTRSVCDCAVPDFSERCMALLLQVICIKRALSSTIIILL